MIKRNSFTCTLECSITIISNEQKSSIGYFYYIPLISSKIYDVLASMGNVLCFYFLYIYPKSPQICYHEYFHLVLTQTHTPSISNTILWTWARFIIHSLYHRFSIDFKERATKGNSSFVLNLQFFVAFDIFCHSSPCRGSDFVHFSKTAFWLA